jgi:hypothetical protein
MKTLVRPAALRMFIALCSGVVFLSLAACQSLTTVPEPQPQPKLVHYAKPNREQEPLRLVSIRDSVAIDPQPQIGLTIE